MPIRDHFHPPLLDRPHWESVHGMWAANITRRLNRKWLPEGYLAQVEWFFRADPVIEVDVGVGTEPQSAYVEPLGDVGSLAYSVPPPDSTIAGLFAPAARVFVTRVGEGRLRGAIELVSEGNKDRPAARDAFAARMQTYLQAGVSLMVIDLVTNYRSNLHNRWTEMFLDDAPRLEPGDREAVYVAVYRPYVERHGEQLEPKLDLWLRSLAVGDELPVLPLFIDVDQAVPVELELTYMETCGDIRLPDAA